MSGAALTMRRMVFMVPGGLALLGGLNGALMLLDVPAPLGWLRLRDGHGVILVIGFVGTLIALERAVALRTRWGFSSPLLLGVGALLVMSPAPFWIGRVLWIGGSMMLVAVYVPLWRRHADATVIVQLEAAGMMAAATVLWWREVDPAVFLPWLVGFVVLTIAAERIELARIGTFDKDALAKADTFLLGFAHAFTLAALGAVLWPRIGTVALGLVILGLVTWLWNTDVARKLVKASGAQRYMAACLLSGYVWLFIAGVVWMATGHSDSGPAYDAVIHSVFLGFTMTMIMAHAPVILPAVIRQPLPYRSYMYGPLVLLHIGLVLRVLIGDAFDIEMLHRIGGVLNVIALLAFVAGTVWSALTATSAKVTPLARASSTESSDAK